MDANSRDELIDKLNDKAGQARETVPAWSAAGSASNCWDTIGGPRSVA